MTGLLLMLLCISGANAALVNHEARLVAALLDGYNPQVKPTVDPLKKMDIHMSFSIGRVESLDERNQILTTFGWISMTWQDELLSWDPAEYGGMDAVVLKQSAVWVPELSMRNSVDDMDDFSLISNFRIKVFHNGFVWWLPGFKWQTSCAVNLSLFPFDTQVCNVQFVNWVYGGDLVHFRSAESEVDISNTEKNNIWNVTNTTVNDMILPMELKVSQIEFTLTLKRNPTYFVWNVLTPVLIMTAASLLVFMLPAESGEKIGLSITILLGYSVVLLMVSDITPQGGETMPFISMYIVISMIMTGMCLFLTVLVLISHHHPPRKPVPRFLKLFIISCLGTLVCMQKKKKSENMVEPFMNANDTQIEDLERKVLEHQRSTALPLPQELLSFISKKRADDEENDEIEDNRDDWERMARILDRVFFFLYLVVTTALTTGFMSTIMNPEAA